MPRGKKPKFCYEREGNPFWWYQFKIEGRKFSGSTGCEESKAAATFVEQRRVDARQQIRDERENVAQIKNGRKQITLEQALNRFENDKGHTWKSLRDKKRYADYLLNVGDGGKMLLSEISEEHVVVYRQRRKKQLTPRGEIVSDSTLNREVSHLQACMNYCGKTLKYDIAQIDWKLCKDREAEREQQWVLSPSQEQKLFVEITKTRPELVPLVQFAIWAAVRKAAAVDLRWDHVNLEDRVATIYLKSRGRPKAHLIALTDRMAELLEKQPRVEGCDHVFTYECKADTRDRKGIMRYKGRRYKFSIAGWTRDWNKAKRAAGLDGFRFHDLRHTGATRLTRTTGDVQLTKEQLGHADIKTTLRYSKVDVNDIRAAQELAQRTISTPANDQKVLHQSTTVA